MSRVGELKSLFEHGIKENRSFDGYGYHRMIAALLVRDPSFAALQLYAPSHALAFIEQGIKHGTNNYIDFIIKSDALIALRRNDEARACLVTGIAQLKSQFADDTILSTLTAENVIHLETMYKRLESL